MKKLLSLFLVFSLIVLCAPAAFAKGASTYKYAMEFVDEVGDSVTSGILVYVKTINTNTNASIWNNDNTTSGTLTGRLSDTDSDGDVEWYGVASSFDVIVQYRGTVYVYSDYTPSSDRRIVVSGKKPSIDLNAVVDSADTMIIPEYGDFFQIAGTTNINNIASTGHQIGKTIKLLFGGNLQIGQNGNITISQKFGGIGTQANPLSGTLTCGAGTLIQLLWDGTKWRVF